MGEMPFGRWTHGVLSRQLVRVRATNVACRRDGSKRMCHAFSRQSGRPPLQLSIGVGIRILETTARCAVWQLLHSSPQIARSAAMLTAASGSLPRGCLTQDHRCLIPLAALSKRSTMLLPMAALQRKQSSPVDCTE